jgi:hypothetical protein
MAHKTDGVNEILVLGIEVPICAVMVRVGNIILHKERRGLIRYDNSKRATVPGGLN